MLTTGPRTTDPLIPPPRQRGTPRLPVTLEVALYDRRTQPLGARPYRLKTRNISVGGMFIETATPLPVDACVVLAFGLRVQDARPYYRLPARVVRVAADGMGVAFSSADAELVHSLRCMLRRQHVHTLSVA